MFNRTVRHLVVATLLAATAVAGVTAASAAGDSGLRHTMGGAAPIVQRQQLPLVNGELGEVVVRAPGDLGEVVVHAPGDLGEVLVSFARAPAAGQLMADVVVSARRVGAAGVGATAAAALLTASL